MTGADTKRQVDEIKWCHAIDPGTGIVTPGAVRGMNSESELGGDLTNRWGPDPLCVDGMPRTVGFRNVATHGVRIDQPLTRARRPDQARTVFHARN